MMNLLRSLTAAGALALTTIPGSPITAPTAAYANPAIPEKLWDGFSAPTGIAVHSDGAVHVSNWGAGAVYRTSVPR